MQIYTCRFKSETCRRCGKQGYIQRVCRSKPKSTSPPGQPSKRVNPKKLKQRGIHAVQSASDSDSEDFDDMLGSNEIHSIKNSKSNVIWITPEVDGKLLKMELDTGSGTVSVLPFSKYQKLYPNVQLEKSTTLLKTYTGEKIKPNGKMQVTVKHSCWRSTLLNLVIHNSWEGTGSRRFASTGKASRILLSFKTRETRLHQDWKSCLGSTRMSKRMGHSKVLKPSWY